MKKITEIKPVGRRLLVEQEKVEKVTKGGIVLPDDVTEREQNGEYLGTVVAVGELAWRDLNKNAGIPEGNQWCKVGDKILFHRYSHTRANPDYEDMRILINDSDVIAVVETEAENE